jgi:hypothetical protein
VELAGPSVYRLAPEIPELAVRSRLLLERAVHQALLEAL